MVDVPLVQCVSQWFGEGVNIKMTFCRGHRTIQLD